MSPHTVRGRPPDPERLGRAWARAIASTSFAPLSRRELHTHLTQQSVRLLTAVATEQPNLQLAREAGAALVAAHFAQPASLARTLTVLGEQLRYTPTPRLNAVLAALAAGYCEALREQILAQQEQIRVAALQARSQAEHTRWAQQARYQMAFAACPHAVAVADIDCRILDANPAFCDLLGYTAREIGGLGAEGLVRPDDASWLREAYQELIRTGRRHLRLRQQYLHKDGQTVMTDSAVSVARDQGGEPRYLVLMIERATGVADPRTERTG